MRGLPLPESGGVGGSSVCTQIHNEHRESCAPAGTIFLVDALDCNEIGDTCLEVLYEDKKFEKLCTDEREMRKKREDVAGKLKLRIKALETAESIGELPIHDPLGNWHPLGANLDGLWAGKLSANFRLLVRPEDSENPLCAVTVTVIKIDDYH